MSNNIVTKKTKTLAGYDVDLDLVEAPEEDGEVAGWNGPVLNPDYLVINFNIGLDGLDVITLTNENLESFKQETGLELIYVPSEASEEAEDYVGNNTWEDGPTPEEAVKKMVSLGMKENNHKKQVIAFKDYYEHTNSASSRETYCNTRALLAYWDTNNGLENPVMLNEIATYEVVDVVTPAGNDYNHKCVQEMFIELPDSIELREGGGNIISIEWAPVE